MGDECKFNTTYSVHLVPMTGYVSRQKSVFWGLRFLTYDVIFQTWGLFTSRYVIRIIRTNTLLALCTFSVIKLLPEFYVSLSNSKVSLTYFINNNI